MLYLANLFLSKSQLQHAEVLAVVLRDTITEYKGYSWKEAVEFIEVVSMTSTMEVSSSFLLSDQDFLPHKCKTVMVYLVF